jgi:DNA anti-recombination protein RmuC
MIWDSDESNNYEPLQLAPELPESPCAPSQQSQRTPVVTTSIGPIQHLTTVAHYVSVATQVSDLEDTHEDQESQVEKLAVELETGMYILLTTVLVSNYDYTYSQIANSVNQSLYLQLKEARAELDRFKKKLDCFKDSSEQTTQQLEELLVELRRRAMTRLADSIISLVTLC